MKYLDWVDDYVAGTLPEAECAAFEAELERSEPLRQEVALAQKIGRALRFPPPGEDMETLVADIARRHQAARAAIFQQAESGSLSPIERADFEEKLHSDELLAFEWKLFRQKRRTKIAWLRPAHWAIAASLALTVCVALWWLFQNPARQSERLFARYDLPELQPRSEFALVDDGLHHLSIIGSDDFSALKMEGLHAFDAKNWDEAIRLLSDYLQQAKPSAEEMPDEINLVQLYIGRSWLEKGDASEAVVALKTADAGVTDPVNYALLKELIRWQLALAHLKNKDIRAAVGVLETLKNARQETIRSQANKLLRDLT